MLSSILAMALFYGICIFGLLCDGGIKRIKRLAKSFSFESILIVIGIFVLFTLFVMYWAKKNKYIYYWDLSGYWHMSIDRAKYMTDHSILDSFKTMFDSINIDEYNVFLPTVIAGPFSILGYSYTRYRFLVCIMFLLPAIVVQGLLATKIISKLEERINISFEIGMLISLIMPANYYAVFRGYIDAAYLLPISVVIYLFVDYDFRRISVARNIMISLLLIISWISRRYVVFFIIGFIAGMIIKAASVLIEDRSFKSIKTIAGNFLIIGAISLGILFLFFKEFLLHALFTNYGQMYSAYDAPISQKINFLKASFGLLTFILIMISGILCLIYKRNRAGFASLFAICVVSTVSFWAIQVMGVQHRMILNVPIFALSVFSLDFWSAAGNAASANVKHFRITNFIIYLCTLAVVVNFTKAFCTQLPANGTGNVFSERYYALERDDLAQIHELVAELNELTSETGDHVYVAASGNVLNCDMLRNADMPDRENAVNNLFSTHDVDLRDGFPTDFLNAGYIVTTSPVDLHLATGQKVVSYIAESIQDSESFIGCHYEKIYEIELQKGVVAKIYAKVSEYTEDDLQQMRDYYGSAYPNNEELFENRIHL